MRTLRVCKDWEISVRILEEFQDLVTCFYQGSDKEISSLEEWAAMALRLSEQERSPS